MSITSPTWYTRYSRLQWSVAFANREGNCLDYRGVKLASHGSIGGGSQDYKGQLAIRVWDQVGHLSENDLHGNFSKEISVEFSILGAVFLQLASN